jgi:hypothetical protein
VARLTAAQRRALPDSAFAIPSRRAYPIHDASHARNALARAAQRKTRGAESTVKAKVRKRYRKRIKVRSKRRYR